MNALMPISWMQRSYGYHPGIAYHHAYGGGSWITQMLVSSIVHGLIYSAIFRVLRHLSLGEILIIALVVIGLLYARDRDRTYRR